MSMQGFRGNCDSQASWGCAPALPNRIQVVFLGQAAGEQKFFDPAIFQKCWRGSGRAALIAARRQRNPCAMLLAHGGGGEKSDSFSRRGEQDRSALWNLSNNLLSCNCSDGTIATEIPYRKSLFLGKTTFSVRQKGVSPLLLPASVLQLPRFLVWICNSFLINHKIANLTVSKNAIAAGKTDCKIEFSSQMWAARPHLGSIFEKLLHRKTFICLRLVPSCQ